ncbi:Uncharacterized protein Anas_05845 [Armadillidium nasatum]|uniref:CDAN1-interacting nuclease 1 n=1 Tax=Armadillidium nasatum TaxID=96803 RepID=A0A5N5T325_9CRUS|nr:Uncharacterized protein Anas_05845 [Armadillidium nasatum]
MRFSLYNKVVKSIEDLEDNDTCVQKLCKTYPELSPATLESIYSQWIQRKVKKSYHKITQCDEVSNYCHQYQKAIENGEPPGVILRLAKQLRFSPAMTAKIILEYHLNVLGESKGFFIGATRSKVNKLLRDTTLITDRDLSYEVYLCLIQDDTYGPFADSMKHSLGHEYEFLLKNKLEEKNIAFQDENVLRSRGYDKTPDFKLDIPIAIDGHVVNWIESKASFGDEENHRNYLRDQFWSYWNRFGPGLVIYWFGFIEELDEHKEKGILIKDHMPDNITFMNPLGK